MSVNDYNSPPPPPPTWQDRLHDAATRAEDELRHVISYLNDEVVPDVRRSSSQALRTAAAELHKLAQRMDDQRTEGQRTDARRNPPPPPSTTA